MEKLYNKLYSTFLFIIIVLPVSNLKGQTKNYLSANKTGNIFQSGSLIGLGTGNADVTTPMTAHRTGILNTLRFYYGDTILSLEYSNPTSLVSSRVLGVAGLVGSGGDAYIQFRNAANANIASGTTTYFKIGTAPSVTGLSASVGGLLGLADVYNITGNGYSGAGNYTLGSSYNENVGTLAGTTAGTRSELLLDKYGTWYAAVTPNAIYNSVRLNVALSNSINLVSLTRDLNVSVYNAFYYNAPVGTDCGTPIFTTAGETQGVSLNLGSVTSLLSLDSAVSNPKNAIDDDTNTYSRITSGALGIATDVSQTILYNGPGTASDVVKVKLSLPLSALTVTLLTNVTIAAYKGNTMVGTAQSLNALLTADVLGLLGDNTPFYVNIKPGAQFDRVKISLGSLLSIGSSILGGGLRIYDTKRVTNAPVITLQPSNDTVCEGNPAVFNTTATGDALTYQWQSYNGTLWSNVSGATNATLGISNTTYSMNGKKYRVKISGGYCASSTTTYTSGEAVLTVKAKPATPPVHLGL